MVSIEKAHSDDRGEIYHIKLDDGSQFNLLITKALSYRAGDEHPNNQYDLVLKGEVLFTQLENRFSDQERNKYNVVKNNELIELPKFIPHLFLSLTDSIVLEWWDGPFESKYYQPYRKFVDEAAMKNKSIDVKYLTDAEIIKMVRG
jgi:hypothetical protein